MEEATLQNLVADLLHDNFEPYLTSVGGRGLGILSPYERHRDDHTLTAPVPGQVTPPDEFERKNVEDGVNLEGKTMSESLRSSFVTKSISDLTSWADGRGRWLFV